MRQILAAADIGSNTTHMLVAATDGMLLTRLENQSEWIPLGEVVARSGAISSENVRQVVMAIKEFKRICSLRKADSIYLFATEGMRTASNSEETRAQIQKETGITVDLITPRREAELSLLGASLDGSIEDSSWFIEVGGGSAQIASILNGRIDWEASLPLGTGRVVADCDIEHPCLPKVIQAARFRIRDLLSELKLGHPGLALASGGVARGLMRALHPDGDKVLNRKEIEYIGWACERLTVDRIAARFSVKQRRASTLLAAALVFEALMERLGIDAMQVSEFGIREGAILEVAGGRIESCRL